MGSAASLNVPVVDIDYADVACRNDSSLVDAETVFSLRISAVIGLDNYWIVFSNDSVCLLLYFLHFLLAQCRVVGDIEPAISLLLECRILPDPRAKYVSRCRI